MKRIRVLPSVEPLNEHLIAPGGLAHAGAAHGKSGLFKTGQPDG